MGEALLWGAVAASSLVIGAALALARQWSQRAIAIVMAFGAGVLISAVSYELVLDAFESGGRAPLVWGLAAGAVTFFVGDLATDRLGGAGRKRSTGVQASGGGAAIAFGTVLDGIPESVVLGTTLISGSGVSIPVLAAIFLSNLPEAMSATAGLKKAGTSSRSILLLWIATAIACTLATGIGFAVMDSASPQTIAFVQAFAAGALLTMLADTMMPEAFEFGGPAVGLVTTLGFAVAFGLSALE